MKRRDRILAATSVKELCPEARPTPSRTTSEKTLRICRGPLTPTPVYPSAQSSEIRWLLSPPFIYSPGFFFPFSGDDNYSDHRGDLLGNQSRSMRMRWPWS